MSYKSNSVMKEVLHHLDETLLPPELLAVPDRKKDATKVSGASTRLYNENALKKKHEHHLEIKQKEAERFAKQKYDAEQDKHLKKFWKVRQKKSQKNNNDHAEYYHRQEKNEQLKSSPIAVNHDNEEQNDHSKQSKDKSKNSRTASGTSSVVNSSRRASLLRSAVASSRKQNNNAAAIAAPSSTAASTTLSSISSSSSHKTDTWTEDSRKPAKKNKNDDDDDDDAKEKDTAEEKSSVANSYWSSSSSSITSSSSVSSTVVSSPPSARSAKDDDDEAKPCKKTDDSTATENPLVKDTKEAIDDKAENYDDDFEQYTDDFDDMEDETDADENGNADNKQEEGVVNISSKKSSVENSSKNSVADDDIVLQIPSQAAFNAEHDFVVFDGTADAKNTEKSDTNKNNNEKQKQEEGNRVESVNLAAEMTADALSPIVNSDDSSKNVQNTTTTTAPSRKRLFRRRDQQQQKVRRKGTVETAKQLDDSKALLATPSQPLTQEALSTLSNSLSPSRSRSRNDDESHQKKKQDRQHHVSPSNTATISTISSLSADQHSSSSSVSPGRRGKDELEGVIKNSADEKGTLEGISNVTLPSIPVKVNNRAQTIKKSICKTAAAYSQLGFVRQIIREDAGTRPAHSATPEPRLQHSNFSKAISSARSNMTNQSHDPQHHQSRRQQQENFEVSPQMNVNQNNRQLVGNSNFTTNSSNGNQRQHRVAMNDDDQGQFIQNDAFTTSNNNNNNNISVISNNDLGSVTMSKKNGASNSRRRSKNGNNRSRLSLSKISTNHNATTLLQKQRQKKQAETKSLLHSLEPHIKGDEILVLCEFLSHHQNTNAPVSAMSKSLSLKWIMTKQGQEKKENDTSINNNKSEDNNNNNENLPLPPLPDDDTSATSNAAKRSPEKQQQQLLLPRRTLFDLHKSIASGKLFHDKAQLSTTDRHRVCSPRSAIAMIRSGLTMEVLTLSGVNKSDSILRSSPFQKKVLEHAENARKQAAIGLVETCIKEYQKILDTGVTQQEVVEVVREVASKSFAVPIVHPKQENSSSKLKKQNNDGNDQEGEEDQRNTDSPRAMKPPRPVSAPMTSGRRGSKVGQTLLINAMMMNNMGDTELSSSFLKQQKILDATFQTNCRAVIQQYDLLLQQEEKDKAVQERIDQIAAEKSLAAKRNNEKHKERASKAKEVKTQVAESRRKEVIKKIIEEIESSKTVLRYHEARRLAVSEKKAVDETERMCARTAKQNMEEVAKSVKAATKEAARNRIANHNTSAAAEFVGESVQRRRQEQILGDQIRQAQQETLNEIKRQLAASVLDAQDYAKKQHE